MSETMNEQKHIQRHRELHHALDELIADFADKTGRLPSEATLMELMEWSHRQTIKPDTKSAPINRWRQERPSLAEIVEQLRACGYACEAGPLENNVAFQTLERLARGEEQ